MDRLAPPPLDGLALGVAFVAPATLVGSRPLAIAVLPQMKQLMLLAAFVYKVLGHRRMAGIGWPEAIITGVVSPLSRCSGVARLWG